VRLALSARVSRPDSLDLFSLTESLASRQKKCTLDPTRLCDGAAHSFVDDVIQFTAVPITFAQRAAKRPGCFPSERLFELFQNLPLDFSFL